MGNRKKSIPPQRLEQLSEYFGIEKEYLGNLSESDKQHLLEKAMFRYFDGEKETYLYRLKSDAQTPSTTICFPGDRENSLDERYIHTQRKMKQVLEKSSEIIRYYDKGGTIQGQISCINRGCRIYDTINTIMDEMPKQKVQNRMLYFHEIDSILLALSLAFGLTSEEEILNDTFCSTNESLYDNNEWIFSLSKIFKEHWDNKLSTIDAYVKTHKSNSANSKPAQVSLDINEKIKQAEDENREFWREHPEMINQSGLNFPTI